MLRRNEASRIRNAAPSGRVWNRVTGVISARHYRARGLPFRGKAGLRARICILSIMAVAPCFAASVPLEVYGRLPALEDLPTHADAATAAKLAIRPGLACLTVERWTWRAGEWITFVRQTFPADRYTLLATFEP